MTNELTLSLNETLTLGQVLYESGLFQDIKGASQAVVKILAGRELGFSPIISMAGIHVINGKACIGANLIAAAIKRHPHYDYQVISLDDTGCELMFYENGKEAGPSIFTLADARKAGTKNLDKYARNMYFARAISNGAKWYTPDIFGGTPIYTPDELDASFDEEGEIIVKALPQTTTAAPQNGNLGWDEAIATYDSSQPFVKPTPRMEPRIVPASQARRQADHDAKQAATAPPEPTRKQRLAARIEELWQEEKQLGGSASKAEYATDLAAPSEGFLVGLGTKIAARITALSTLNQSDPEIFPPETQPAQPESV